MKIDIDMNIYLNKSIGLIGIMFMVSAFDSYFRGHWFWMILALISIIIYAILPSIKIKKSQSKEHKR